jgi:hypothetical protein
VAYRRRSIRGTTDPSGGAAFRFDRETGTNEMLSSFSFGSKPAISSDGNLIAFISGGNLVVRNMNTEPNVAIGQAQTMRISPDGDVDAVFTPDNRFVLFKFTQLQAYDLSSNRTHRVSAGPPDSGLNSVGYGGSLSVSSNSVFVVFTSLLGLFLHDLLAETNGYVRGGRDRSEKPND